MSNVVDIFIKTYEGDFSWLKYCLESIRKFAFGFRRVVIVCDGNNGAMIPFAWLPKGWKVCYVPLPKQDPHKGGSKGYLWQQCVKLNWVKYTDADSVLVMDSDWMFTTPICPQDFQVHDSEGTKKYYWVYRSWDKADTAIKWKEPVEAVMKQPCPFEAMCISGFILTRDSTLALQKHLFHLYRVDSYWDLILQEHLTQMSEFNMLGTFVYNRPEEYRALIIGQDEDVIQTLPNHSIRSSWSWGGLKEDEAKVRDGILHGSILDKAGKQWGTILANPVNLIRRDPTDLCTLVDVVKTGCRILVPCQTDPKENGIWERGEEGWTRPNDYPTGGQVGRMLIMGLDPKLDPMWVCMTPNGIIDKDAIWFSFYYGTQK